MSVFVVLYAVMAGLYIGFALWQAGNRNWGWVAVDVCIAVLLLCFAVTA